MLNFFTFQSKVKLKEERTSIYRDFIAKNRIVRFVEEDLDGHNASTLHAMSGQVPMTRAHVLLHFRRLIFIRSSLRSHVSLHDSPSVQVNRDRRISLMRSTVAKSSRAYDQDQVD